MSSSERAQPKAVVHKQILRAAREHPEASVEELAAEATGATVDLVERVLDRYGDPADESAHEKTDGGESSSGAADETATELPSPSELSTRQRDTLEAIRDHPEKSQQELGELLGVSGSAISQRLRDVDGFEWSYRKEFVDQFSKPEPDADASDGAGETDSDRSDHEETDPPQAASGDEPATDDAASGDESGVETAAEPAETAAEPAETEAPNRVADTEQADGPAGSEEPVQDATVTVDGGQTTDAVVTDDTAGAAGHGTAEQVAADAVAQLHDRVDALEGRLDARDNPECGIDDPELLHKVITACMDSDSITEDEEVRILDALVD